MDPVQALCAVMDDPDTPRWEVESLVGVLADALTDADDPLADGMRLVAAAAGRGVFWGYSPAEDEVLRGARGRPGVYSWMITMASDLRHTPAYVQKQVFARLTGDRSQDWLVSYGKRSEAYFDLARALTAGQGRGRDGGNENG